MAKMVVASCSCRKSINWATLAVHWSPSKICEVPSKRWLWRLWWRLWCLMQGGARPRREMRQTTKPGVLGLRAIACLTGSNNNLHWQWAARKGYGISNKISKALLELCNLHCACRIRHGGGGPAFHTRPHATAGRAMEGSKKNKTKHCCHKPLCWCAT